MRYPFTPDVLADLPEELAKLFQDLEATLLYEICSRLKLTGDLNEVTVQDIRALRSHGIELKDIEKAIKKVTGISDTELKKLFDDVIERNQKYYTQTIDMAGLTQPETLLSVEDTWAIYEQTKQELHNITRSMGFLVDNGRTMLKPAKAYQWACDSAVVQIQSGAISYNQAIKSAVQQLANSGLKTVDYESGATSSVDVAVRRAVMTGVNQLNRKYTEDSMHFLQTDIVEVSAHPGARDTGEGFRNHKAWQGKLYRWAEFSRYYHTSKKHYPDFQEACGYGDVQGILGANCRHSFSAFVEGVMQRAYTDKELEHIDDGLGCEYDGKKYSAYEATQMQRRLERQIIKQKRRVNAFKDAGLSEDADTAKARLTRLNAKYKGFSKAAGLPEQIERKNVNYRTGLTDLKEFAPLKEYSGSWRVVDKFSARQYVVDVGKPKISGARQHFWDNLEGKADRNGLNIEAAQNIINNSKLTLYQTDRQTLKFLADNGYVMLNTRREVVTAVPEKLRKKYCVYLEEK